MFFNLRHFLNILYAKHPDEAMVISRDAQCVFDQLAWPYMMHTVEKFGFVPLFTNQINLLTPNCFSYH